MSSACDQPPCPVAPHRRRLSRSAPSGSSCGLRSRACGRHKPLPPPPSPPSAGPWRPPSPLRPSLRRPSPPCRPPQPPAWTRGLPTRWLPSPPPPPTAAEAEEGTRAPWLPLWLPWGGSAQCQKWPQGGQCHLSWSPYTLARGCCCHPLHPCQSLASALMPPWPRSRPAWQRLGQRGGRGGRVRAARCTSCSSSNQRLSARMSAKSHWYVG